MSSLSQYIGFDCTFELDSFQKPRICSESETIKNTILFILFSRPGQYPSLPYLGMDIKSRLYSFYDDLKESDLESQLIEQCPALSSYFQDGSVAVKKMIYRNMPSLLIHISVTPLHPGVKNKDYYIGLSVNEMNELLSKINAVDVRL